MTTEERFEKLEQELANAKRRNRLLTVSGLVISGLGLIWFLTKTTISATAATTPKEIHANKFVLEDGNGKPRAQLEVTKEGPGLKLFDEKGKTRAHLEVTKDGSVLALADEKGMPRVGLTVTQDGPVLAVLNENGTPIWSAP